MKALILVSRFYWLKLVEKLINKNKEVVIDNLSRKGTL